MGEATAKAVGKAYKDVEWIGEPGVCPACHSNLVMMGKSTTVTCPVCGIHGTVSVEGDELKVMEPAGMTFNPADVREKCRRFSEAWRFWGGSHIFAAGETVCPDRAV